ncbi:MAG TPA: AraC family transcriptional regulator [Candidatus Blautia pullistercoris]|uniref:AraC family transcriptional regulator n=1 Tax=Candidatus Blautia pullistercoris TaxID=2838499 RepID=A0A9D1VKM1_9FIRM|nr:AraC family transcriptional regulator [Candidatus Blautia pullistercoris]
MFTVFLLIIISYNYFNTNLISQHFTEDISLSDVSAAFGVGKYTVTRIFSNVLKISFLQYINSLRIDYAMYLLTNTDLNMTDIAMECGYHSQQTFNRIFKELCSCTPKEYKKIHYKNIVF